MAESLVVVSFGIAILLELIFPLAVGAWIIRNYGLGWRIFGYGAAFFILVQVPHTPLVLAVQGPLTEFLTALFPDHLASLAAFSFILGLLAGLFEEIGRYLVFSWIFPRRGVPLSKESGLLFGAGWGGIESMIIGILVLLTLFSYLAAVPLTSERIVQINQSLGGTLTSDQIALLKSQNEALLNLTPADPLIGLAERLMTFPIHIALTLLVLSSVVGKRPLLLCLAILWHAMLDALAVFLAHTAGILMAETAVAAMLVLSIIYIWQSWQKRGDQDLSAPVR
jgi:uncharacterized membrane protein YhfC